MIDRTRIEQMKSSLPAMWGEERFTGNGPVRPPREGFVPLPPPSDSTEPYGLARITRHVADKEDSQRKSFATQMLVDKTARHARERSRPQGRQECSPRQTPLPKRGRAALPLLRVPEHVEQVQNGEWEAPACVQGARVWKELSGRMKPTEPQPTHSPRLLDYLPDHPRFDELRRVFTANELRRAEQLELLETEAA